MRRLAPDRHHEIARDGAQGRDREGELDQRLGPEALTQRLHEPGLHLDRGGHGFRVADHEPLELGEERGLVRYSVSASSCSLGMPARRPAAPLWVTQ